MASFDRAFSASPVLVMSPQSVHQPPFGLSAFSHHQPSSFGPSTAQFGSQSWSLPSFQTPSQSLSSGSRKRSRDEDSDDLDEGSNPFQVPAIVSRPVFPSFSRPTAQPERPALRSSKSQRLDTTSISMPRDISARRASPTVDGSGSSSASPSSSSGSVNAPVIDDLTIHFGIGWRLLENNVVLGSATRGWARYIENHYSLSNVKIYAESKGLSSYLVTADQGWFLFDENLRQGRLVSKDAQRCMQNLRTSPPTFDGAQVMTACQASRLVNNASATPQTADVEMA